MTSKKIPLSTKTADNYFELEEVLSDNDRYIWFKLFLTGIITAIVLVFVLLIIALIVNLFNFVILFVLFTNGILLIFTSALFFMLSGLSIWFGPSPQWADFKSRMLNITIKPKSMDSSLQIGFKHGVTAIMLLFLAN